MTPAPRQVQLTVAGAPLAIETVWLNGAAADRPLAVFLHEGLGSVALWKDWPQRLCDALGCQGLVYSRPGYGRSTPRADGERWPLDFMRHQADTVLPALLDALSVAPATRRRMLLVGHSDGASIALWYAALFPQALAGAVVIAPHTFVEPLTVASIAEARTAFLEGGLQTALSRYHDDVASAFWGWNEVWLDPSFLDWDMRSALGTIARPLLAVQGIDDQYGTLRQLDAIVEQVPHARTAALPDCRHSPHRDQSEALNRLIADFAAGLEGWRAPT
ncbi:alpha/beta fold hydrolase [Chitinasiproducens palmae]